MKQNAKRRFLSVTTAAMALLSLQSGMITASALKEPEHFNWEYFSYVPSELEDCNEVIAKFHVSHDLDFNGDAVIDVNDFYELEKKINELYRTDGYIRATAKQADPDYDIDGDGKATPFDYCYLLKYFQQDFEFDINEAEMTAEITKYNGSLPTVIVPSKVFKYGRIFPVSQISSNAFQNNTKIKTVVFSDYIQPVWSVKRESGVKLDGYKVIPTAETVTACTKLWVGDDAFKGCANLEKVYLPKHVELGNSNVFAGTKFIGTNKVTDNGVIYIKDSSGNVLVAYDVEDSHCNDSSIVFKDETTAISTNVTKKLNRETLTDIQIPSGLEFIEDYAFKGFKKLETICGKPYAFFEQSEDENHRKILKTVQRYNCAFDNTQFLATATQAKVEAFAQEVRDMCKDQTDEKELVLRMAQIFARDTEYSTYYSVGIVDGQSPLSDSNPNAFSRQFNLYPNDLYNTNDICRGSITSASTAFIEGDKTKGIPAYTECESFALAAALVLDQLDIRNYFLGRDQHALNAVYLKDKNDGSSRWYQVDLSGLSTVDWTKIDYKEVWGVNTETGNYEQLKWSPFGEFCSDAMTWISANDQFAMFPNSCDRKPTSGCAHQIYNQYKDGTLSAEYVKDKENIRIKNPEVLKIEMYKPLTASEQQSFKDAPVLTQLRKLQHNAWNKICLTEYYVGENGQFLSNCYAPDDYWIYEDGSKGPKKGEE